VPQWSTSLSGDFGLGAGTSAYLATIIFGVVLIVVMLVAPTGIQGGLRWLWGFGSKGWLAVREERLGYRSAAAGRVPPSADDPQLGPEHGR
jgi:hypothetical protein